MILGLWWSCIIYTSVSCRLIINASRCISYTIKQLTKMLVNRQKVNLGLLSGRSHSGTGSNTKHAFTHLTCFIYNSNFTQWTNDHCVSKWRLLKYSLINYSDLIWAFSTSVLFSVASFLFFSGLALHTLYNWFRSNDAFTLSCKRKGRWSFTIVVCIDYVQC